MPAGMMNLYKARKHGINEDGFQQFPEELEKLKALYSTIKTSKGELLKPLTVQNYVNKINKLSTLVNGRGYNGDKSFLFNPERILKVLADSGLKSQKDYLSPIVKLLEFLGGMKDQIKVYTSTMANLLIVEQNTRNDNLATEKEKELVLPYDDIITKLEKYSITDTDGKIDDGKLINKLIVALYFDNTLIARNNYWDMKIASTSKKPKNFNKEYNYLIIDKFGNPKSFYLVNYKTSSTYGTQKFNITGKILKELLKTYILKYNKQYNDFLFVDKHGEQFKPVNFSDIITNCMNEVVGAPLNINLIRKIHITQYFKDGLHSENDKKEFASRFLHSPDVQKEYVKINF